MSDIDPRLTEIRDCLYRVSAKAVIVNQHCLLLVKEKEGWYDLPGGGVDYLEPIQTTLRREIAEELDIDSCKLDIDIHVWAATNLEIVHGLPRFRVYYKAKLTKPEQLDRRELDYIWATNDDLHRLELSAGLQQVLTDLEVLLQQDDFDVFTKNDKVLGHDKDKPVEQSALK